MCQINVLDTLGMISASFGDWQGAPGGEHVELTDKASGRHLSLCFHDDVMVGCNAVSWTEHIGVMRALVEGHRACAGKFGTASSVLIQDGLEPSKSGFVSMIITLKLFASLTDYLPPEAKYTNFVTLDIAPETTIDQLVAQHRLPAKQVHLVLVNGSYIAPEQRPTKTLVEGDVLAIWPPIAGG